MPHPTSRRRRRRTDARRLRFEHCEPRRMMAADIAITGFHTANTYGATSLSVDFQVSGSADLSGTPSIDLFQSPTSGSPSGPHSAYPITDPAALTDGNHTLSITPDLRDPATGKNSTADYYLFAVVNSPFADPVNHSRLLSSGIFETLDHTIQIQGPIGNS